MDMEMTCLKWWKMITECQFSQKIQEHTTGRLVI